jgi:RNA recognition motif-containing protein
MAKRLYVGNLPWGIGSSELESLFGEYGPVQSAEVIMDRVTGRSRGFGFVQMESDEGSQAAIEALNGKEIKGRSIVVNEARDRPPNVGGGGGRDRRSH